MHPMWVFHMGPQEVFAIRCHHWGRTNVSLANMRGVLPSRWVERAELVVGPDGDVWKDRYGTRLNRRFTPTRSYHGRILAVILPVLDPTGPGNGSISIAPMIGLYVNVFDTVIDYVGNSKVEWAQDLEGVWERSSAAVQHAETLCQAFGGVVAYEAAMPGVKERVFSGPIPMKSYGLNP